MSNTLTITAMRFQPLVEGAKPAYGFLARDNHAELMIDTFDSEEALQAAFSSPRELLDQVLAHDGFDPLMVTPDSTDEDPQLDDAGLRIEGFRFESPDFAVVAHVDLSKMDDVSRDELDAAIRECFSGNVTYAETWADRVSPESGIWHELAERAKANSLRVVFPVKAIGIPPDQWCVSRGAHPVVAQVVNDLVKASLSYSQERAGVILSGLADQVGETGCLVTLASLLPSLAESDTPSP